MEKVRRDIVILTTLLNRLMRSIHCNVYTMQNIIYTITYVCVYMKYISPWPLLKVLLFAMYSAHCMYMYTTPQELGAVCTVCSMNEQCTVS